MKQVLVRNLADETVAAYKQAARDNGRSLEAELRDVIERGRPKQRLSPEQLRSLVSHLHALTPDSAALIDSTALIREDRDAR
ncbi:MAG: hypothetical protein BVN33_09670 [Proteobacteria bacterium ST_bin13]|nr:MAG: hypothetical protein BVN33_09670 [Proteobacteria bacterium ST_bin13]